MMVLPGRTQVLHPEDELVHALRKIALDGVKVIARYPEVGRHGVSSTALDPEILEPVAQPDSFLKTGCAGREPGVGDPGRPAQGPVAVAAEYEGNRHGSRAD